MYIYNYIYIIVIAIYCYLHISVLWLFYVVYIHVRVKYVYRILYVCKIRRRRRRRKVVEEYTPVDGKANQLALNRPTYVYPLIWHRSSFWIRLGYRCCIIQTHQIIQVVCIDMCKRNYTWYVWLRVYIYIYVGWVLEGPASMMHLSLGPKGPKAHRSLFPKDSSRAKDNHPFFQEPKITHRYLIKNHSRLAQGKILTENHGRFFP